MCFIKRTGGKTVRVRPALAIRRRGSARSSPPAGRTLRDIGSGRQVHDERGLEARREGGRGRERSVGGRGRFAAGRRRAQARREEGRHLGEHRLGVRRITGAGAGGLGPPGIAQDKGQRAPNKLQPPPQVGRRQLRQAAPQGLLERDPHLLVLAAQHLLGPRAGFGDDAADQAHDGLAAGRRGGRQPQRWQQHRFQDLLHGHRPVLGGLRELLEPVQLLLLERAKTPLEHRLHQAVLGAEVVIDRGEVDLRLEHDVPERCAVETQIGERLFRGVENPRLATGVSEVSHLIERSF